MKRTLTITARVLIFLIGFIFALYYFMDWRSLGNFAVSVAHSQLERNGMRMGYSDISGEEDGFTINNLTLNGISEISFSSITIRPRIIPSILSMALVCDINFRNFNVRLGMNANFGDGRVLLTAGRKEILLENLRTNGDFSLNGYMSIDTSVMRPGKADIRLDVPESFSSNMSIVQDIARRMNFPPLGQEGDKWYIRRR